MQTFLSFEPRYHKRTPRDGKPVWVPMYNPIREYVQLGFHTVRLLCTEKKNPPDESGGEIKQLA